jgi:hypothetical protein
MIGQGFNQTKVCIWSFGYLLIQLFLLSTQSFANSCSTCLNEVNSGENKITCSQGHETHQECLQDEVAQTEVATRIKEKGLRCNGLVQSDQKDCRCKESFSLDQVRHAMNAIHVEKLNQKLDKESAPGGEGFHRPGAHALSPTAQEVRRISQGIDGAFDLCCACGEVLDPVIEGCNAATCPNEACQKKFCYLCLKEGASSAAVHSHVKSHSGNYWELRKGYTDRYHWLLARKKLDDLFKNQVNPDPTVMKSVLISKKAMLKERKMWPFPAGKTTGQWLQEFQKRNIISKFIKWVKNEKHKRIELLQNESIYQRQMKNPENVSLIDAEITKLKATPLVSLDRKDAHDGVEGGNIIPIMEDDPRIAQAPRFFALGPGGRTYQVGNFIWSGVAPEKMNHAEAVKFCAGLGEGSRLPTIEEFRDLARAMGYPHTYDPRRLPDTEGNWFWSSSVTGVFAYIFSGDDGVMYFDPRSYEFKVRCLRAR